MSEQTSLLRIAETDTDDVIAVEAALLGHNRTHSMAWVCGCGHYGGIGESHTKHQATEVLALLARRTGSTR